MNTPQRPLAIINGILKLPAQEMTSGVILVLGETILAAGPAQSTPVPANALLLDAQQGRISAGSQQASGLTQRRKGAKVFQTSSSLRGSAALREIGFEANGTPIQPGQRADLICHGHTGSILWALCAGEICYPPHAPAPPPPLTWQQYRQTALDAIFHYLHQRPQTQKIRQTAQLARYQQRGIDLMWQFLGESATPQTLAIRVIPTLMPDSGSVFVLEHRAAQHLPEASLSHTEAHWWLYHHGPDAAIYALPVPALRQWLRDHASQIPTQKVKIPGHSRYFRGRALPMERLQVAIPRARVIQLSSP